VAPHLHRGETIYYEIYGNAGGKHIQAGYPYDCRGGEFKVVLYRVTLTSLDGYCIDLNRKQVYARAIELGMNKPYVFISEKMSKEDVVKWAILYAQGKSTLDSGTLREGIACWFEDAKGVWKCLKYKSEEFLLDQDKRTERNESDVEDIL